VLFYLDFTKFVAAARTSRSREVPESSPPVFRHEEEKQHE